MAKGKASAWPPMAAPAAGKAKAAAPKKPVAKKKKKAGC